MSTTLRLISIFGLGLMLSSAPDAHGNLVPKGAAPLPKSNPCPTPSAALCLSKGTPTLTGQPGTPYIETACGKQHAAVCKPHIEKALEDDPARKTAPKVKMLKAKGSDIPADLREGEQMAKYGKPKAGKEIKLAGKNVIARTGLTRPPGTRKPSPASAHRKPAWDANGQKITSCEEYGYEQLYDWTRFTDAAAACAGDDQCELDMAYLGSTPGIANRTLARKDGKPLKTQFSILKGGSLPKNEMFAFGARFVYAGGGDGVATTPELEQMKAALEGGKKWYGFGCNPKATVGPTPGTTSGGTPCSSRRFVNEWGFHKSLREANKDVSPAEFAEYEKRKQKFRELVDQWGAAVAKEQAKIESMLPKGAIHKWISPIDVVSHDPMERIDMLVETSARSTTAARSMMKKLGPAGLAPLKGAGVQNSPVGVAKQAGQQQGWNGDWTVPGADATSERTSAPVGVLAVPKDPASDSSKKSPGGIPSPAVAMCDPKNFTKVYETIGMGPHSCRIGQFLRLEWQRKLKGQKSCLDPDVDDCDWSPRMFEQRFVEGVPYIEDQHAAEVECRTWTGGTIDVPNLTAAENYIKEMKAAVGAAKQALRDYDRGQVTVPGSSVKKTKYGKTWEDAESFGDKDWFAAGYDYSLGWDVQAQKLNPQDQVCQLEGGAHGGFGVDGWFIGNKFEVVDGLADGDVNRSGSKQAHVHAHLRVFSINVFDPVEATFTGAKDLGNWSNSVQIPPSYKPSFTFMAGPVPITGAVWGEFFYGAKFNVEGILQSETCDPTNIQFGAKGTFTPQLGLNAKAQIGVGISGLLSAGIRGMLNLVTVGVPVNVQLLIKMKSIANNMQAHLGFSADVDLMLATLSGYLSLYVEFLFFEEEWELFSWSGVSETIDLMPTLSTDLPLVGM
jgi:hypothetical protein